jgi:hypothetical protein
MRLKKLDSMAGWPASATGDEGSMGNHVDIPFTQHE